MRLVLALVWTVCGAALGDVREQAAALRERLERQAWSRCSSGVAARVPVGGLAASTARRTERKTRQAEPGPETNRAAYLVGATGTLATDGADAGRLPWRHFSVALWARPEGGQPREAVLLGEIWLTKPSACTLWARLFDSVTFTSAILNSKKKSVITYMCFALSATGPEKYSLSLKQPASLVLSKLNIF